MDDRTQPVKDLSATATALTDALLEFENGLNARRFGLVLRCTYTPPAPSTVGVSDDEITIAIDRQGRDGWTLWIHERKVWKRVREASVTAKVQASRHIPGLMLELQAAIKRQTADALVEADKLTTFMRGLEGAAKK